MQNMASSAGNSNSYTGAFPQEQQSYFGMQVKSFMCTSHVVKQNIRNVLQDLIKLIIFTDSSRALLREAGLFSLSKVYLNLLNLALVREESNGER